MYARTIYGCLPCGTCNIFLKTPPKSIVLPPKGMSAATEFSHYNKSLSEWSSVSMLDGLPLELHLILLNMTFSYHIPAINITH